MMHSNIPENQWSQVKGEIQKTWNRLDADELEQTHGDVEAISDLVQKRYALDKDQAEQKIDEVIDRCGTSAGPATFDKASASSAGPASLGSNVDPSSLSAGINQDSSLKTQRSSSSESSMNFRDQPDEQVDDIVHASSFDAPEEGLDSAFAGAEAGMEVPQRDSRAPEDFNTNEPKMYGSEGQVNDSRSQRSPDRQTGNSSRSEAIEGSTGDSSRSQTFEKSARNSEGSSTARAGDSRTNSARDTRSSEDSSQE